MVDSPPRLESSYFATVGSPDHGGLFKGRLPDDTAAAMTSRSATRSHDLLPLPLGSDFNEIASNVVYDKWFKEAVKAINEMGGRGASVGCRASLCQRLALNGLAQGFAGIPECPPSVTVKSAL